MAPRRQNARNRNDQDVPDPVNNMPVNNQPRQFVINVQNFDGEPSMIEFFFSQLEDLVRFNQYSNEQALAILKSKLVGNALDFYLSSPELKAAQTLAEAKDILVQFFSQSSNKIAASEFNNIKLLPGENIKHLAHRVNSLAFNVYPQMQAEALNQIKFVQFLAALPSDMQCKIYENGINTYSQAVAHAQKVQDAQVASCLTSTVPQTNFLEQIAQLKEQVNLIQSKSNACQLCNSSEHTAKQCILWTQQCDKSPANQYSNEGSNFHKAGQSQITCQFCGKYGHVLNNCFAFQKQHHSNVPNNNFRGNFRKNSSNHGAKNFSRDNRYDRKQDSNPYYRQNNNRNGNKNFRRNNKGNQEN